MTFVRTVLGDRDPSVLGVTNYHEHLFQASPLLPGEELDDEAKSLGEARNLRRTGTRSMVDATPIGLGRNLAGVARIAATSGLHVIAATGRHHELHYPAGHWMHEVSVNELESLFLRDLTSGCPDQDMAASTAPALAPDDSPIRAGLIKTGIGYWSISGFERRTLEAAASAHQYAGAPIMVHLEFGTAAHEVLDLLEALGVDAGRVILAHADRNPDQGLHLELTARGAYLGYDGMARPRNYTDERIIELIAGMSGAGSAHRLLLGGDVARRSRYVAYGGMPGLAYLADRFLPRLEEAVGALVVKQLTEVNPARILSWPGEPERPIFT